MKLIHNKNFTLNEINFQLTLAIIWFKVLDMQFEKSDFSQCASPGLIVRQYLVA